MTSKQQFTRAEVEFIRNEFYASLSNGAKDPLFEAVYQKSKAILNGTPDETSGCTRSHPHELMSAECELRTEIARLTNQLARWESPDNWGAFVELLGLPRDHVNKPLGVAAAIALLNSKLDRYMKALQTANGFLIMNNLDPVKLDYSSEKTNGDVP